MATAGSPCPSRPFLASGQGCGAERSHGRPLPPSAPGPPSEQANGWAGRGTAWPRPPGRLFLGLLRATGRWLLPLASWGALSSSPTPPTPPAPASLQPDSSPTPARFQPDSNPAPARLRFSTTPLCEFLAPRTLVPRCPSLCPSVSRTTATSRPPKSQRSALLPSQPRHTPPPFFSPCPSVRLSVRLPARLFLPLSSFPGLFSRSTRLSSFAGKSQKPLQKAYNEI